MNENEQEQIKRLLKQTLPPTDSQTRAILGRDLWPAMQARLQARSMTLNLPWFDWALLTAVIVALALFPKTILILLYHL